jgi:pyruvate dehydrogenase E2 component (dihydrolipoamide acetyltransferase)
MPSLGADMERGTVVEWLVQVGARVRRGDVVAVIDTEKATIEIEIFEDGVIEAILVPVGEEVPVGAVLARVAPTAPPALAATNGQVAAVPARTLSSPLARRRAAALGIDVATLAGTGPGHAVTADDVEAAVAVPHDRADRRGTRHALATLMARSKREIPHYYLSTTIDMSAATAWLADTNADRPPAARVLPAALLLRASALAARAIPDCNGFWRDGDFRPADGVHLGVAINLRGGGVVAPAIHDADRLSVDEIMARLRDLVRRARAGGLRASEISEQTITVTNLGDQGAETVFGVIYPPQVALIGFGRIVERPWAANGMLAVRPVLTATLAGDHRANDGHQGGLLLAAIDRALQEPENQ